MGSLERGRIEAMRGKLLLSLVLSVSVLGLAVAGSAAAAADQPNAQGFRILLTDGSVLKGAISFTMNIDTQYGRLTISSTNFLSARFNIGSQWAVIRTRAVELRVRYKPDSSNLEATSELGPVNVELTKVVSIQTLYAQVPNAAPSVASNPYGEGSEAAVPSGAYAAAPPTVVETVPSEYSYAETYPVYAEPESYGSSYAYSYVWSPGYGFVAVGGPSSSGGQPYGTFQGRFRNSVAGRAFSSRSFGSAAAPTFRHVAPVFRSTAGSTFHSGPTARVGGGSATSFHGGGTGSGSAGGRFH
jgi:hypothetical protein